MTLRCVCAVTSSGATSGSFWDVTEAGTRGSLSLVLEASSVGSGGGGIGGYVGEDEEMGGGKGKKKRHRLNLAKLALSVGTSASGSGDPVRGNLERELRASCICNTTCKCTD